VTDKVLILIGPIILAVYYLAICITNGFQVGLGRLVAFAYPLVLLYNVTRGIEIREVSLSLATAISVSSKFLLVLTHSTKD